MIHASARSMQRSMQFVWSCSDIKRRHLIIKLHLFDLVTVSKSKGLNRVGIKTAEGSFPHRMGIGSCSPCGPGSPCRPGIRMDEEPVEDRELWRDESQTAENKGRLFVWISVIF